MLQFDCIFVNVCNYTLSEKSVVPIGQLSLATYITKCINDASARVIDMNYVYSSGILKRSNRLSTMINETAEYICSQVHDGLISLYTMCNTHHFAIMIAKDIKQIKPSVKVCLAGPQASIVAKQTLEKYPFIDFVAIGEGELTISEIIHAVRTNNFAKCTGVAYRHDNSIIVVPNNSLLQNLDELPMIDYGLLNFSPKDSISIEVGRGCPFSCSFCSTNDFWKRKYRIKSPDRIFSEVKYLNDCYGITKFGFEHDLFLINKSAVLDLCKLIVDSGIKIKWGCSSRLDCIDEELIHAMSEAGCFGIFFGIESGSSRMQKIINKNLDLSEIKVLVSQLKKYGVFPTFSFIYGFPDETESDIEETLSLMYMLYNEYKYNFFNGDAKIQFHKLMFLPGTEITTKSINDLVPLSSLRTDVQHSETRWNNTEVNKMLLDRNIFPQFYGLKAIETSPLSVLDVFFSFLLLHTIEYLDCTYRALYFHYKSHLAIFYSFVNIIGIERINSIQLDYGLTVGNIVQAHMHLFEDYINHATFGEDSLLIRDMFQFEYTVYCQAHSGAEFYRIITFEHDVIKMKRESHVKRLLKKSTIVFYNNENSKKIKTLSS